MSPSSGSLSCVRTRAGARGALSKEVEKDAKHRKEASEGTEGHGSKHYGTLSRGLEKRLWSAPEIHPS